MVVWHRRRPGSPSAEGLASSAECVCWGCLASEAPEGQGASASLWEVGYRTAVRVSHLLTSAGPPMTSGSCCGVMWGPERLKSCQVAHLCLAHPAF